MINLNVKCQLCGRSLMDKKNKIDSQPSIKLLVANGKAKNDLHLSSLYGSRNIKTGLRLPKGKIMQFYCPHCRKELKDARRCESCRAPMIPLERKEGGLILVCSRKNCKTPLHKFETLEAEIKAFYDTYWVYFK